MEDVEVLGIVDKESANIYRDMDALHKNVYPMLPAGVPNNPDDYAYLKVGLANGKRTAIGLPWIIEDSIVISASGKLVIEIENVTPEEKDIILRSIDANGFRISKVSLT